MYQKYRVRVKRDDAHWGYSDSNTRICTISNTSKHVSRIFDCEA